MTEHAVAPLKADGPAAEILESFCDFVSYREHEEGKSAGAIKNDYKAMRALLGFYGIDGKFLPRAPTIVRKDKGLLPSPEDIYALLHAKYASEESYTNALVRYLLAFDFGYGIRCPSEAHVLKVGDFDAAHHVLRVTEPKKGNPTRRLYIEPEWLCCNHSSLSLANYLKWRKKVNPDGKEDAFFLKPDGKPFASKYGMSNFLNDHVKPLFPWFHPYLGRTWCANARLIDYGYDYSRVADWLGHESVDMLRAHYDQGARLHEKVFGKNWLVRAFIQPQKSSPRLKAGESPGSSGET